MATTHRHNLSLVRAIGIPVVLAISSTFCSILWLAGDWAYSTYLKPQVAEISISRKELENKHRELLAKSGFKNDVQLGSVSDATLKSTNYKLEKALRSGK